MATKRRKATDVVKPGQYYEDCSFHPCLCVRVDRDEVSGVSLIDGSYPRSCDVSHCGVIRLTFKQAMDRKFYGPPNPDDAARVPEERRWWVHWRGDLSQPAYHLWPEPKKRVRSR
jgi:hypothetical protein